MEFSLLLFSSSHSESYRDGQFRNHFMQLEINQKVKSDVYNTTDAGMKAKVTYKIDGKIS